MNQTIETRRLSEEQNANFDRDYHAKEAAQFKFDEMTRRFGQRSIRLLDLGGGNGRFLDQLLDKFPTATGFNYDISEELLQRNSQHDRKICIHGDIADIRRNSNGMKYDVIQMNWILHHLVGNSFSHSVRNVVNCLEELKSLLTDDGIICVSENLYEGIFGMDYPSRLIYFMTSIKKSVISSFISRYANTASVGVCFHSDAAWHTIFAESGLTIDNVFYGESWNISPVRRLAFILREVRQGHYILVHNKL